MKNERKSFVDQISETLIKKLKEGTAPWQKPWRAGNSNNFMPHNFTTGNRYRGINALVLMSQEREDGRWLTYKQASALGAQVQKGEMGTTIQYWKTTEQINKLDANGKPMKDEQGKPIKVTVKLERPRMFMATVFNAEQIDGLPPQKIVKPDWNPLERAENILNASTVKIKHTEEDRAFYRVKTDSIHLPGKAQFDSPDAYYATALHELGHSTGHTSRLDRDLSNPFGSEGYAKEELRAEIASMMLGHELNIGHDPDDHAAYVKSWIKILEDDPKEILRASADAEKIMDSVLSLEQKQEQEQEQEIQQDAVADMGVPETINDAALPDNATITAQNTKRLQALTKPLSRIDLHAISIVGAAFKFFRHGSIDKEELEGTTQSKLGFKIPPSWNGHVVVEGSALDKSKDEDGRTMSAKQLGVKPEFWSVYVQLDNNDYELIEDFKDEQQANAFAEKLALIDVIAAKNEETKTEKITLIEERMALTNEKNEDSEMLERNGETPQPLPQYPNEMTVVENGLDKTPEEKLYLAVPYAEKEQAKKAGARWDNTAKSWYVGEQADMNKLKRWLPDQQKKQQEPAQSPVVEFTDALRSLGCVVSSPEHVKMDGQKQRIRVEGDKGSEKSGFYVSHLDGRPAGYIKNNRTSEELRWKAKGYSLSPEQKAKLHANAAIKQQERRAIETERHNNISKSITDLLKVAPFADRDHPYLLEKQIRSENLLQVPQDANKLPGDSLIKIGQDWNESKQFREQYPDHIVLTAGDLLIPAQDVNNKTWTVQTINSTGSKMFAAGGKKESHFVVTGGLEGGVNALKDSAAIVIAEGYATADTLSQVLKYPTVAAFDSGNLKSVAEQLHQKFPDKAIIIAGDDDIKNKTNVGREKAADAAEAVGGIAIFPTFAPKEQLQQGLSDFNDLANKSVLGNDAVKRQAVPIIAMKVKTMAHENTQLRKQSNQSTRKAASR